MFEFLSGEPVHDPLASPSPGAPTEGFKRAGGRFISINPVRPT